MKKFLILLLILIGFNKSFAYELPKDYIEYINKPYVGMAYNDALDNELPFLLIFARPSNAILLTKLLPIAQMVYDDFKGQYNFCIINVKIKENYEIYKFFDPPKLPAVYIIDTQNKTYTYIEKKYYNKNDIRNILTKFKNGTLFQKGKS